MSELTQLKPRAWVGYEALGDEGWWKEGSASGGK